MRIRDLLVLAPIAALFVACAVPAAPSSDSQEGDDTSSGDATDRAPAAADEKKKGNDPASTPPAPAGGAFTCPYTGPGIDVSAFPVCREKGRCIPDKAFPPDQAAQKSRLAPCDGGFCVPEVIVKSQNNALPKSCRSFAGLEGRCTSMVFPDIEKQKDSLPQDACDASERCAPCFDPTGKATGACSSVSCDAPKEPFKPFRACCTSGGKSRGSCLPSASFSTCVKMDFLTQLGTAQGTCSADSFCAPCKNPLTGAATGAPNCGP